MDMKRHPFDQSFISRNTQKSQGAKSGEQAGWGRWSCYFFTGIPSQWATCVQPRCRGAMTGLCSSTSQAVCTSHFHSVISKPRSKEFPLTVWPGGTNSLCTASQMKGEGGKKEGVNSIDLMLLAANLARFSRSRRGRRLPLRTLLHCFRVIIVQLWFITSYDPGHEVRIMSNSFLQLSAHLNLMVLLVTIQETMNKLRCNSSRVQLIRQNELTWPVWESNTITNIMDSPSSVF
jgi:hypothetical protein